MNCLGLINELPHALALPYIGYGVANQANPSAGLPLTQPLSALIESMVYYG